MDEKKVSIHDYKEEIYQLLQNFPTSTKSKQQQKQVFELLYNLTYDYKVVDNEDILNVTDYYISGKSTIHNHKNKVVVHINDNLKHAKEKITTKKTSRFLSFTLEEKSVEKGVIDYIEDIEMLIKRNKAEHTSRNPVEVKSWISTIDIFYNYSESATIERFESLLKLIKRHNIKLTLFCKYDFKHFKELINYEKGGKIVITEIDKYFHYMYALIKTRSMNDPTLDDFKKKEQQSRSYLIKYGSVEELNISYDDNFKKKAEKSISNFILHHEMRINQVLQDSKKERHTVIVSKEQASDTTQEDITRYIDVFAKLKTCNSRELKDERNSVLIHINRFYITSGTESSFFKSIVWMIYSIKRLDASDDKKEYALKSAFAKVLGDSSIFSALRGMKKYFGHESPFEYIRDVNMDAIMQKIHLRGDKKEAFSSKFSNLSFPANEKIVLTSFKDIANKEKNRIKLGEFLNKDIVNDEMATEELLSYFSLENISSEF